MRSYEYSDRYRELEDLMQIDRTFPWFLLIGHWLGDYIFQKTTQKVKVNKLNQEDRQYTLNKIILTF